jgi:hypothetical protein
MRNTLYNSDTTDSGGKVNIFGIYFEREKTSYEHVSDSEWLPRYSCLNLKIQTYLNDNKEREISCC